ncbi:hypothetical protein V6N11_059694 [Hibiscus sabdariffa]|uniref:DUF538 family protein n=1 Tax=Hibiscus sabdariffa TaxID=183260 RepID=A0ABR2NY25_9ROSI
MVLINLATAIPISLLILLFLLIQSPLASSFLLIVTDDEPSAYEVLQAYNFPVGLLPKGVVKYDLDESTGRFHAYLNDTCSFSLEGSYQLKYKSTISGIISNYKLKDLSGISVKVFFLWLNIVEVIRDDDELDFSVGIASASFPIDNFYECPQCGCGLDCVNAEKEVERAERRTRADASVASNMEGPDHMIVKAWNCCLVYLQLKFYGKDNSTWIKAQGLRWKHCSFQLSGDAEASDKSIFVQPRCRRILEMDALSSRPCRVLSYLPFPSHLLSGPHNSDSFDLIHSEMVKPTTESMAISSHAWKLSSLGIIK